MYKYGESNLYKDLIHETDDDLEVLGQIEEVRMDVFVHDYEFYPR